MPEEFKWVTTCNRFVAFLDIMGFKDMVSRHSHQDVKKIMESFEPAIGHIRLNLGTLPEHANAVRPVFFSDSILLVSNDGSGKAATLLSIFAENILAKAMSVGIPLKGAIAYGEQTADFDKSLHFGRPLIDAFLLQEQLLFYGIALHHTADKRLSDAILVKEPEFRLLEPELYKYATPLKTGIVTHTVLDLARPNAYTPVETMLANLYGTVSGEPRRSLDNTRAFAEWLAKEKLKSRQTHGSGSAVVA